MIYNDLQVDVGYFSVLKTSFAQDGLLVDRATISGHEHRTAAAAVRSSITSMALLGV